MGKLFLFDIEGTTTDINFVHKVLFPYSKERMAAFVTDNSNNSDVSAAIEEVKKTVLTEEAKDLKTIDEVVSQLLFWIETDRKHGALKTLQGLIWDHGYKAGDFQGHVYEDVKPFFQKLKDEGHNIGIYSSGSVHAQKLIFGFSSAGDLTSFISFYFDTKIGAKREVTSYQNILKETNYSPEQVTFFSDIPQELEAAKAAGINAVQLLRPGTASSHFPGISDFSNFNF